MAKFCPECGKELGEGVKFCPGCGKGVQPTGGNDNTKVPSDTDTRELTLTSNAPADAVVLKSSAPIPSKIGWTKWGWIAGLILIAASGFGILVLIGVFIVSHFQMSFHKDKMRKMKFKFFDGLNSDDIFDKLAPILSTKYGNRMEFDREGDTLSVTYDSIIYDINVNDDSTFSLWWRKSLKNAFFSWNEWKEYKKIRTGTAVIAYELQKAYSVA